LQTEVFHLIQFKVKNINKYMKTGSFLSLLSVLIIFLLPKQISAQIEDDETIYSTDRVTAFRLRSDFDAELDEDEGWAADVNQSVSQTVDIPFRIRFEIESDTAMFRRQYSLQYRWNKQPWTYLEAHEFPYPSAASPAMSITACDEYFMGEEAGNLIPLSSLPSDPGAGINLSPTTPGWWPGSNQGASSEWEFALIIRRWADGPKLVKNNDTFAIRVVDHLGQPLEGPNPEFNAIVTRKHLGGTFVETPARIGPYESSQGDLYFIMEPTETENVFMMLKSTDQGETWFESDAENRPLTDDLEGVGSVVDKNGVIHIVHQISEAVYHHAFAMSGDSDQGEGWIIKDRLITRHAEPLTQAADIAMRPDGSLIAVFCNGMKIQYSILGNNKRKWSKPTDISPEYSFAFTNPSLICLPDGTTDFTFKSIDGVGWHRRLSPDNALTTVQPFARNLGTTEEENISILPLLYIPENQSTVAVYRKADGYLYLSAVSDSNYWSDPIKISHTRVITNAVDSDQTGADAVVWDGNILLSYIAEQDRSIYYSVIKDLQEPSPASLLIKDIEGSWIRGNILHWQNQRPVYGIVYDAGSKGGSGFNKFFSLELEKDD